MKSPRGGIFLTHSVHYRETVCCFYSDSLKYIATERTWWKRQWYFTKVQLMSRNVNKSNTVTIHSELAKLQTPTHLNMNLIVIYFHRQSDEHIRRCFVVLWNWFFDVQLHFIYHLHCFNSAKFYVSYMSHRWCIVVNEWLLALSSCRGNVCCQGCV